MEINFVPTVVLCFTATLHFLIASLVFIQGRKRKINVVFSLLTVVIGIWTLLYGITYLFAGTSHVLFFTRIMTIPAFFYPSIFFYLAKFFPEERFQLKKRFFIFHAVFIIFFLLFVFSRHYIFFSEISDGKINFKFGPIYNLLTIYIVIIMLSGSFVLFRKIFILKGDAKNQVKLVFFGALISILVGALFSAILPAVGHPQYNFFSPTGTLFVIGFLAIGILKYRLLDISIAIKVLTSYSLLILLAASSMILSYFLLVAYLPNINSVVVLILLGLIWTGIGDTIRKFLITTSRRVFVKNYYNPQLSLLQVTTALNTTIEKAQIFMALGLALDEILQPAKVIVGICNKETGSYQFLRTPENERHSTTLSPWEPTTMDWFSPIEKLKEPVFMADMSPSDQQEILVELPKSYRKQAVLMPLTSSNGESEGFVILAEKDSGQRYTASDSDFLKMVQHIANGTLDKIRPYEEIRAEYNLILRHETQLETALKMIVTLNHEINNPLTAIYMSAQVLENMLPHENIKERHLVGVITLEINRVMGLMKQLEKTDRFCETTYVSGVSMMKVAEKS